MSDNDAKPKADGAKSLSTAGLERMFRAEKFDHPDLVGGIVWADCELAWINERITLAILAEREACASVCDEFDFNAREEIAAPRTLPGYLAAAIRMRSNVKVSCPEAVSLPEGRARP